MTAGPIERSIRNTIRSGTVLATPSRRARFTVATVDERGVVLLLGEQGAHTRLSWDVLEGVPSVFGGGAWIPIGSVFDTGATPGTLDDYLKGHIKRATAGWVAALLEAAGLVEIDRARPARVRLRHP